MKLSSALLALLVAAPVALALAARADDDEPAPAEVPQGSWVYTPAYGWLWVPSAPATQPESAYPPPGGATMPPAGTGSSGAPGLAPGSATMPAMPAPPGPPPAGTPRR